MPKFVIQEHFSRTHHFDLRLEKDGVFKSWAVPKGVPQQPGIRRLAVQVQDHELKFGDFQGTIPKGEYGAGKILIWDKGQYDLNEWSHERIVFVLRGSRINGDFTMFRFKARDSKKWLIELVK